MEKTTKKAIVEKAISMLTNDQWNEFKNLYTVDENSLIEHLADYLFSAKDCLTADDIVSYIKADIDAHKVRDIFTDTLKAHHFTCPTASTRKNEALIIARMAHGSHTGAKSAINKVAKMNNIQIRAYKYEMGYVSFLAGRI